jgi:hypothetical protein
MLFGFEPIEILFMALSAVYALRAIQIALIVKRNWASLKSNQLAAAYRSLAEQAAFFLAVPVGVLLHEGAHALATVAYGGQVVEFNYWAFWGSVVPAGTFTANQVWFIALAGTLGSLVFGAAAWLTLRNHPSPVFQYFGLRTFRFQIFFALVYYPIFTLMGFYGDWRIIYDFNLTPLASGLTAVLHAAGLALFWWADRGGFFEMASTESAVARDKLADLERRASDRPQDIEQHLQLIDGYRQACRWRPSRATANARFPAGLRPAPKGPSAWGWPVRPARPTLTSC